MFARRPSYTWNEVATTTYLDVAARAGVGAATVYRHFPTMDALVETCGEYFWNAIEPPNADAAVTAFAGLGTRAERLKRLVEELDAFYERAAAPLWSAVRDQDRVAPLARFLADVGKGVAAFVAEALREEGGSNRVRIASAIADFMVWRTLSATGIDRMKRREIFVGIIEAAIGGEAVGRVEH